MFNYLFFVCFFWLIFFFFFLQKLLAPSLSLSNRPSELYERLPPGLKSSVMQQIKHKSQLFGSVFFPVNEIQVGRVL